jgi:hypothetical protein
LDSLLSTEEVTGEPRAKMQWVHYFRNIVQRYQVIVEGWPESIPFTNLSKVSSVLPELEKLLYKWESGTTYWRTIDDEELEQLRQEHNEKVESGEINQRRTRSDKGKKHKRPAGTEADKSGPRRKKYKSAEVIEDSDDTDSGGGQSDEPAPSPRSSAVGLAPQPCSSPPSSEQRDEPAPMDTNSLNRSQTPNHGFVVPPFDFDATIARLDELFGPPVPGLAFPTL